ncbi:MAG: hypothetical protein WAX07_05725 [Candidatus Altiarchaeia archaeon]
MESLNTQVDKIADYAGTAIVFAILFAFAYVVGWVTSKILHRVLKMERLEDIVIKYGAMRSKLWADTINFLVIYTKWFVVVGILTLSDISLITNEIYPFMNQLLCFIVLVILGLIVGGFISKFVRDVSMDFGWEDKLVKYGVVDALGDIPITGLLTGIVKWYVVLIFVAQGVELFENLPVLTDYMTGIMAYIPQAMLGGFILLVALLIADYTGDRIKQKQLGFSETIALFAETVIVFLGTVIALPHFGVYDTSILKYSFLILATGISLAIAIAFGLGLKDSVSKFAKKYEGKNQ